MPFLDTQTLLIGVFTLIGLCIWVFSSTSFYKHCTKFFPKPYILGTYVVCLKHVIKNYKITDDRYISYFIRFLHIKKPGMEHSPKHSTSTDIPVKQKGTKDFLSLGAYILIFGIKLEKKFFRKKKFHIPPHTNLKF